MQFCPFQWQVLPLVALGQSLPEKFHRFERQDLPVMQSLKLSVNPLNRI